MSSIFNCTIMDLPKIHDRSGNLTSVQNFINIPFSIKRIYYLYDVPSGESRAAHGHKELQQLIIAASGSFDIKITDGINTKTFQLNRPNIGLHIVPGIWRDVSNFSSGAICLVLASEVFLESDYLRNYQEFLAYKALK